MKTDVLMSVEKLVWTKGNRTILEIESFQIQTNEVIALIGPNGAGKSSLLKMLALLDKPDSGKIRFKNHAIPENPLNVRRKMAMVFQEPLLLSGSVYKNVAQGLLYRGLDRPEIDRRVHHWLEVFKISHLARRNQKHLSGGEAQRVSLARAMAVEPEILFLDEPFAALDQPTRQALAEEIGQIIRERQISAVFVTHNAEELSLFTDRICILDRGKLIQEGTPDEVFNQPANPTTASLVGVENVILGRVSEADNHSDYQTIEANSVHFQVPALGLLPGTPVNLYIRPEGILPTNNSGQINTLTGRIEKTVSLSSQYKLLVDCGISLTILVSKGTHSLQDVRPGHPFCFHLPPNRIHVVTSTQDTVMGSSK